MKARSQPSPATLLRTAKACIKNAEQLVDGSFDLEFREPPRLQLYVLLIAQEEYAKAFLLLLIRARIVPFNQYVLRAMNDHACKQLVGLVMDYIAMRWETIDDLGKLIEADLALGDALPPAIESAITLLRFEKIGRWESRLWEWDAPPSYDAVARQVAEGRHDRRKQDALYVRIGGDGRVCRPVPITNAEVDEAKERLSEFRFLINSLMNGDASGDRYEKAIEAIREMFAEVV
jgi:hypothetical protein